MDEGTFVYVVTGHPRRDKLKNMFRRAGAWIKDNQQIVVAVAVPVVTAVIAGGVKITHDVIKHHNLAKTEQLKTMYCYDPQLGHYWKLKRELSNRDWLEINTRKRHGEDLGSILNTMNVLD